MEENEANALISNARKSCLMCSSRRRLRHTEKERESARNSLQGLYRLLLREFDELRKEDASTEEVAGISSRRRKCLDLMDECDSCSKEVDYINRGLLRLK